jgi:hypothetical protein
MYVLSWKSIKKSVKLAINLCLLWGPHSNFQTKIRIWLHISIYDKLLYFFVIKRSLLTGDKLTGGTNILSKYHHIILHKKMRSVILVLTLFLMVDKGKTLLILLSVCRHCQGLLLKFTVIIDKTKILLPQDWWLYKTKILLQMPRSISSKLFVIASAAVRLTCTDHRIIEILGLRPSNRLPVSY